MAETLPILSTSAIVVSGIALLVGYRFIKRRQIEQHKRSMIAATVFAALFLVLYVARFFLYGSHPFGGDGVARVVYLGILIPHMILATALAPLALVTLGRGLRSQYPQHRRLARITFPTWLFVAGSGWVIFMMLYVLY